MFSATLRRATAPVLLAAFAACSTPKKEDPIPVPAHAISWTVDGNTTTTNIYSAGYPIYPYDVISITTYERTATNTQMRLNVPKAVGTHTFSTTDASASYAVMNANYFAGYDPTTGTVTGAGTIVVSELTATSVTGTFTFTGIDQQTGGAKSVLSGKFFVGL